MRKAVVWMFCCLITLIATAQEPGYASKAHAHNDYQHIQPFYDAWNAGFASIEADVHLYHGRLLVGHDSVDLQPERSLEQLYLQPLAEEIHSKRFSNRPKRELLLLLDVKTDSIATLAAIIQVLQKFPAITADKNIRIVISGNRPAISQYDQYPSFIWFDGRLGTTYAAGALSRIALLSDNIKKFTRWSNTIPLTATDERSISILVQQAHDLHKPIRFWNCPDTPTAWEQLRHLKVDYINTDSITAMAFFLRPRAADIR